MLSRDYNSFIFCLNLKLYSDFSYIVGMKFDLNSMSSHEMSSNFAQAMPKLVRRRGGMIVPTAGTLRRYSDSGIEKNKIHIQH